MYIRNRHKEDKKQKRTRWGMKTQKKISSLSRKGGIEKQKKNGIKGSNKLRKTPRPKPLLKNATRDNKIGGPRKHGKTAREAMLKTVFKNMKVK